MGNSILSFAEHKMPQALGEFGKAKDSDVSAKIIALLTEAKRPVKDDAIWKAVQQDLESVDRMQKMLQGLVMANKIQFIQGGPNSSGYTLVKKVLSTRGNYLDYSLLPEAPKLVS